MGFTSYYRIPSKMDSERFDALVKDVKVIIKSAKGLGIELANGNGEKGTKPKITKDLICFNGVEEDSHETLYIAREDEMTSKNELVFNFCKTARKPYDTIVSAVLVAVKKHFPESNISSDGGMETFLKGSMEGQKGGIPLCVELFGEDYVKDFKMRD
jgi:hypothetical protein